MKSKDIDFEHVGQIIVIDNYFREHRYWDYETSDIINLNTARPIEVIMVVKVCKKRLVITRPVRTDFRQHEDTDLRWTQKARKVLKAFMKDALSE
uniref:Uncharacterized protein n=1 Tax=viral metagenome TaxID=1070528 RepID=A0A6M3LK70_9ZZZZ